MNEQGVPERAPSPAETPTPEVLATPSAPTAPTPDLPPIAAKADDLEAIKKAVDDAASVGGGLWLSYLFVLFYLAVAAGAVTHADLFFENPVKLPFLNIELPLLAFFFLAPILFLVVHAYTLVHLVMLTDKAKRFHQALHDQIGGRRPTETSEARASATVCDGNCRATSSSSFSPDRPDVREGPFGWLLRAIAWVTLVIAPVLLLLMMQIQFLPFHSSFITWTQRVALLADLVLSGGCGARSCPGARLTADARWASWAWTGVGVVLSACAVLFSSGGRRPFPASGRKIVWRIGDSSRRADEIGTADTRCRFMIGFSISQSMTPTRRRRLPFSSTLVLTGLNVYEGLDIDDPEKAKWRDFVFRARGRDLKGAIFDLADLPKVDFEGAELQGASLQSRRSFRARRSMARSFRARRSMARSFRARRSMARSFRARRSMARSFRARRSMARSFRARRSTGAQLQGASLNRAQLQGASLNAAQLQGASLDGAQLQGASLDGAQLQGASLDCARASGRVARLRAASGRVAAASTPAGDRSFEGASLAHQSCGRIPGAPKPTAPAAIRLPERQTHGGRFGADGQGKIHPWNDKAYQELAPDR